MISGKITEIGIANYKRVKTPKYTQVQRQKAESNSKKYLGKFFFEKKYFGLNRDNKLGNARFYSGNKSKCSDNVRFKGKCPKMVIVWVAISPRGMSKSQSADSLIYFNKCLEKSLLVHPFIQEHHADSNNIFWLGLASSHYSGLAVKWMNENINIVPKHLNSPNVS